MPTNPVSRVGWDISNKAVLYCFEIIFQQYTGETDENREVTGPFTYFCPMV
jgi:hypothetical protein